MIPRIAIRRAALLACMVAGAGLAWSQAEVGTSAGRQPVDMYVAVWGTSGELVTGATVSSTVPDGSYVKAEQLPAGVHYQPGLEVKTTLEVEHPDLGRVQFELVLPDSPRLWVDVAWQGPSNAQMFMTPPAPQGGSGDSGETPLNDLCENAFGPLPVPSLTFGSTVEATIDTEAPFCDTSVTSPGVWYSVIGTGNTMLATTCGDFFDYDTKISVYCGDCLNLVCIAGNDDDCSTGASGLLSTVEWCSQAGAEYLILVHGFGGGTGGFNMLLTDDGTPCDGAIFCDPVGACCLPDGSCMAETTEGACTMQGGMYQGDGTACTETIVDYAVFECSNLFEDIGNIGMDGPFGDDVGLVVPIGFDFAFYDGVHNQVGMSTNGYLSFGPDLTDFSNDPCPDPTDPNDALFTYWDDFIVDGPGQTFFATLGTAPDRRFIAQWTWIREFGEDLPAATFQAVLFEGSNTIEYRYLDLVGIPSSPGDVTIGVENQFGTVATCVPDTDVESFDCLLFVPITIDPVECCNSGPPLVVDDDVLFSQLDGSAQDLDGAPDGVLTLHGLHIRGIGHIIVDVPWAQFEVNGTILLEHYADISAPDPAPWPQGPEIYLHTCDSIQMRNFSRIRSTGTEGGGRIILCADRSVQMRYISGIEATPETECPDHYGGTVEIRCGETFRMVDPFTYVTVHAEQAGEIHVRTCGTAPASVRLEGRLIASGWRENGVGGYATVQASHGGMWLPGVDHVLATGQLADGWIELRSYLPIGPPGGPLVSPDPLIETGVMGPPCGCEGAPE